MDISLTERPADLLLIDNWIDPACDALASVGWFCARDALSEVLVDLMRAELDELLEEGRLHRAGIGREFDFQLASDVRRDWIFWLARARPRQAAFLDAAETLRRALNRRLFLGLFEFEAHLALYPPCAFYRRHFDSFVGAANRVVSLVLYLNRDRSPGDGGELVLYAPGGGEAARIEPQAGTLVLMLSEEIEHEVLVTRAERASVAGWFRLNASRADVVDPPR
ncbi:MAG: 2OG-Fe(II) oxygenase [Wenzhouxiangellaceae bacterium]|nr:2OG-Fe(II) oxygenase [Wenzhouxiangellaceae bacterium]